MADARSSHRHSNSRDAQSDRYLIPAASRAELHRRLESLKAGLSTLAREHLQADTEAFEDTMSVLNEEIADLLAVLVDTSL
jgi:hypothetical protein